MTRYTLVLGALLATALPARAADISQLGLSKSQLDALNAQFTAPVVAPGIAFGSPVAFGESWGEAYLGVAGTTVTHHENIPALDGTAALGFGIGNPVDAVGLEVTVATNDVNFDFGSDGDLNFKLHRVLPARAGVAIGVDNAARWGDTKLAALSDYQGSEYVVFTKVFDLREGTPSAMPMSVNIGIGDGRFVDPGHGGVGPFGSLAIAPWRQLSFIADWTGRDADVALSLVPFTKLPVVLTLGATNLGQRLGKDTEFSGGIGYALTF